MLGDSIVARITPFLDQDLYKGENRWHSSMCMSSFLAPFKLVVTLDRMAGPQNVSDNSFLGINSADTKAVPLPTLQEINEKGTIAVDVDASSDDRKNGTTVKDSEVNENLPPPDFSDGTGGPEIIIRTGHDAAEYLLPLRDDHEPALTFRSLFLATILSAFQAVMSEIYFVSNHVSLCGLFNFGLQEISMLKSPANVHMSLPCC